MKFEFKKENNKYLFVCLALLLVLFTKDIGIIFEFLYKNIGYGVANTIIKNCIATVYTIGMLIFIIKKFKLKVDFDSSDLPVKRVLLLYLLTITPIIIISGILGWELKVFHGLGQNGAGSLFYDYLSNILYTIPKMLVVTYIIRYSQVYLENSITFDNEKLNGRIPFGGLFILLTFGIFELIFDFNSFSLLYLFFNLYFGLIYLLTNRSLPKSYFIILLIYLF